MSVGSRPKSTELSRRPRQPEKCGGRLSQTRAAVVIGAAHASQKVVLDRSESNSELCNYAIAGKSTRIIADILRAISEMTNRLLLRGCAQISFAHYPSSSAGAPAPRVRSERDGGGVATSPASCSTYVAAWPPPGAGKFVLARLPPLVECVLDVHGPGIWDDLDLRPARPAPKRRSSHLTGGRSFMHDKNNSNSRGKTTEATLDERLSEGHTRPRATRRKCYSKTNWTCCKPNVSPRPRRK